MPKLYAITPAFDTYADLMAWVEAVLAAGVDWLQYRSKADDSIRLKQATDVVALCRQAQVPCLINDAAHIAHRVQADGVHLGQGDGDVRQARALLGDEAIIGVTCHDQLALAEQAKQDGASYVAFGAFFPSGTKPNAVQAKSELLRQAAELGLPRCAIGGITPSNVAELLPFGLEYIAVVSGLQATAQQSVADRVKAYRRAMGAGLR